MTNGPVQVEPLSSRPKLSPLSAERFALQLTFSRTAQEKLRYAQALLGHALPSGDLAQVLERGLDLLVEKLERQKFAKTARSRPSRGSGNVRYVPVEERVRAALGGLARNHARRALPVASSPA